jgi:predicted AlkP superfamily phosphohydrolase/phosphomutase
MKKNKLLLIGWDSADWDIIWPLITQGKMPALKKLIQNGVYGNMSTLNPPYSPMLWTSVVTGKTPDKHGVLGFIEVTEDASTVRPVTTISRKTRTLWNIFHNQGLRSNVVGWWPSFPVEPINGVIVSDRFSKTHSDPKKQTPMSEFSIHPWNRKDDFKNLRMFPFEITQAHLYPFVPRAHEVDQEKHKGLASIAKIVSENTSIHNAATRLLRTSEWDFMAVYYDLIDHFCHTFMKYHPPKLAAVDQHNYDIFKDAVTGAYIFQDMMLERKMKLIDKDTTVIVMSDHGFESGNNRIINMPKVQAAPSLEHRQFGMFVASGPNIKKNQKVFGMGLIDVAPTILHHYGLSIGKDMDGKVILGG